MAKSGRRAVGDDRPASKRIQIRLYLTDLEAIDDLISAGYGENRSEVTRRSLAETHKWELAGKG